MRERRLYVDYFRNADGSHAWRVPYPPDLLFGEVIPSRILGVVEAMLELGLFEPGPLKIITEFWGGLSLGDIDSQGYESLNHAMFDDLEKNGIFFDAEDKERILTVWKSLLFPLYFLDLSPIDNFTDLPPAEHPEY
jgi:hypothetical protein